MPIVDRYVLRQILVATFFVTMILVAVIFLTQSLRFLDLVINAGASGWSIWAQTFLILPSFFETILPIGMVAGVLFIYNRLLLDNELVVLRALGFSPLRLGRPVLLLSCLLGIALFFIMGWVAPLCKTEGFAMKQKIKDQMSSFIFQEGVFNNTTSGLMIYIRDRDSTGNMQGLIIHDSRNKEKLPSTVIAAKGILVTSENGQQVVVYEGSRQELDPKTRALRRLDFDRYTIDIPTTAKTKKERFQEPDERTLSELLSVDKNKERMDRKTKREFKGEIQKRILSPFLVPAFSLVGISFLLLGGYDRRGQSRRIMLAITLIVLLQVAYLISYNLAKQSSVGFPLMLISVLTPIGLSLYFLRRGSLPPTLNRLIGKV